MIFKVFYQKNKSRNPRRETTQILYLDLDVQDEKAGVITGRELLAAKTNYTIEFIEGLSDDAADYERQNGGLEITTL